MCVIRGFEQKFLAYFLDPGLGKTSITLQLFKMLKMYGKTKGMLIVAPIRVCHLVWPLEIKKWSNFEDFTFNVMHGPDKNLWDNRDANIHIINPAGLPWLLEQLKGKRVTSWPFDMLVVDESTAFKNYSSARFKLIKKLIPKFARRYILTGTPIPNGYMQLFSQMQLVDEGRSLGTGIGYFRAEYFRQVGRPEYKVFELRDGEEKRINRKISPFVVRLSAEENLTLPPLIENKILIEMPKPAMKSYEALRKDMFVVIKGKEIYPPTAASVAQKLHQMSNGNLYEDWDVIEMGAVPPSSKRPYINLHKEKLHALEELLDELNGKPLFIAYWYHHDLLEIEKFFKAKKKKVVFLNSKTTDKEAIDIEKNWNAGKIPILIAQPASVAHGLNFQGAGGDVCWYSLIYDLEIFDQFVKRLWRQGAKATVRVHFLIMKGTIDEVIYQSLQKKDGEQQDFFKLLSKHLGRRIRRLEDRKLRKNKRKK